MDRLIPAAEYVRMSTKEQPNSIMIQQAAIRRYADEQGFQILMTYADPGRSGIEIEHRPGLRQLIQDVIGGKPAFQAILVFDVSRWGRFQDTDESAHYEFLCRSAGIPVHYCDEQFQNNGTISSDIMKALKRTMAAEYSRDLAKRVKTGMHFLAQRGFHVGSPAGYGMRRLLISADGCRKQILRSGELKNIKTDRVILIPGPKHETDVVRSIFFLAAEGKSPRRIAEELIRQGIRYPLVAAPGSKPRLGRTWNKQNVRLILKNEKYIGSNIWGQTTRPFNRNARRLPRSEWSIKENAFTALIPPEQFARVHKLFSERNRRIKKPEEFYLKEMRRILAREGKLTQKLLKRRGIFDHRAYIRRFGSTFKAYELVGFKPSAHAIKSQLGYRRFQRLRAKLMTRLADLFPTQLKIVQRPHQADRPALELDNLLQVAVHICRPVKQARVGGPRWVLRRNCKEDDFVSLICLSDKEQTGFSDFYVVPEVGSLIRKYRVLSEGHPLLRAGKRLNSLSEFYAAATTIAAQWKPQDTLIVSGDTVFDERASRVRVAGKRIKLSPFEAKVFKMLIRRAGAPVPVCELGAGSSAPTDFVRRCISALRVKLGRRFRTRLVTVLNKGYLYKSKPACRKDEA